MSILAPMNRSRISLMFAAALQFLRIPAAVMLALPMSVTGGTANGFGGGTALIEVTHGDTRIVGKLVGLSRSECCMMDRDGYVQRLPVAELSGFRRLASRFRPNETSSFRQRLLREFPERYEVRGTSHYLVCCPEESVDRYAGLFEEVYRSVVQFFRVRDFEVVDADVPLVAIVCRNRADFASYCRRDGMAPAPTLAGYYSLVTNRVVLFDDGTAGMNANDTIVHEAMHQVAHNIGVHSRVGSTPLWLIEGLATVYEAPGIRSPSSFTADSEKLNQERHAWFTEVRQPKRQAGDLKKMIASDDLFRSRTLDAYSEAWAFTYFLFDSPTRLRQLSKYVQLVRQRDPMIAYSAEQRLDDFTEAFGDIDRLEVEFLRSIDRL